MRNCSMGSYRRAYTLARREKLPQSDRLRVRIRSNGCLFKPGRSGAAPKLGMIPKGLVNSITVFNLLHIQITLVYSLYKFLNTFPFAFHKSIQGFLFTGAVKKHDGSCNSPVEQETSH
jgi:hypothetical protein